MTDKPARPIGRPLTKNPAIDMQLETQRAAIEVRLVQIERVMPRYRSPAEWDEYRKGRTWLKKHPRAWEKVRS